MIEFIDRIVNPASPVGYDIRTHEYAILPPQSISAVRLTISALNGASGNTGNGILGAIKRIRLRAPSGEDVLDMTGTQAFKLGCLRNRDDGQLSEATTLGVRQSVTLNLDLGSKRGGQKWGMLLTGKDPAVLFVDIDLEYTRACGAAGFVSGSLQMTCEVLTALNNALAPFKGMIVPRKINLGEDPFHATMPMRLVTSGNVVAVYLRAYKKANNNFVSMQKARASVDNTVIENWAMIYGPAASFEDGNITPLQGNELFLTIEPSEIGGTYELWADCLKLA
jgi:hypothetical protein